MGIAGEFSGLEMDKLIGAPLTAAADASIQLANSTADFINRVGFDKDGKVRTVAFMYQKRSGNDDGTSNLDAMKVDVPMLAIVPIPNLQVDEVNILFDMEVKQSEKKDSSLDMSASLTGSAKIGPVKISVTGSVSAHESNTRSSDNSAKYHVDVRASNHGMPEGLARVLDMMAANVAPALVNSELKDGNGQDLSGKAKQRAEKLKQLRAEISLLEKSKDAANDAFTNSLGTLKSIASSQQKAYQAECLKKIEAAADADAVKKAETEKDTAQKKLDAEIKKRKDPSTPEAGEKALEDELQKAKDALEKAEDEVKKKQALADELNQSWNDFLNSTADVISLISDQNQRKDVNEAVVLEAMNLKAPDFANNKLVNYTKSDNNYYAKLASAQNAAVNSCNRSKVAEEKLYTKNTEYQAAIAGVDTGIAAT